MAAQMGDTVLDDILRQVNSGPEATTPKPAAAPAVAGGTKFYNRPIPVPSWMKTAGKVGGRLLGVPGAILGGAMGVGSFVKDAVEPAVVNAMAGPGPLTPEFQKTVQAAGGANAFQLGARSRISAPARTGLPVSGAAEAEDAALVPTAPLSPVQTGADAGEIIASNYAPIRGTGGVRNNATGTTTALDARGGPAVTADAGTSYTPATTAGGFARGILGLKQITGDNALRTARAKAATADVAARGTAARGAAALENTRAGQLLASKHLENNPGDYAGAAAVLHGRAPSGEKFTGYPNMQGGVDVLNRGKGTVTRVDPQKAVTAANIEASMKARKLTREQALEEYRKQGFDVSGIR